MCGSTMDFERTATLGHANHPALPCPTLPWRKEKDAFDALDL
jgi:hypothetical protein